MHGLHLPILKFIYSSATQAVELAFTFTIL